jgi:hypothetical protein
MNRMNATLTSRRPNGFPRPPRDGFPIRDVRFAHGGPLPDEGSGEGERWAVQGIKARNLFRRILSPTSLLQTEFGREGEDARMDATTTFENTDLYCDLVWQPVKKLWILLFRPERAADEA